MNPDTVLSELRERYGAITSYQDDGVVLSQLPGSDFINETSFRIWFTRPSMFRFDWTSHHPYPPLKHIQSHHRILQCNEGVFLHRYSEPEPEQLSDISLAISAGKGVSGGSSYTVPRMLLCATAAFASDALTVQAITDGETDEIPCRCVIAADSRQRPYRLYIGRDDLLLYRVSSSVMDGSTSDEIHRNIRINHSIEQATFHGKQEA
jgi:hypothetical protein